MFENKILSLKPFVFLSENVYKYLFIHYDPFCIRKCVRRYVRDRRAVLCVEVLSEVVKRVHLKFVSKIMVIRPLMAGFYHLSSSYSYQTIEC